MLSPAFTGLRLTLMSYGAKTHGDAGRKESRLIEGCLESSKALCLYRNCRQAESQLHSVRNLGPDDFLLAARGLHDHMKRLAVLQRLEHLVLDLFVVVRRLPDLHDGWQVQVVLRRTVLTH